jgi:hypothetical protein
MYVCMHVCMYAYEVYAWLYMYVSQICTYVRMYVHVYMHMYTNYRLSMATGFKNWHCGLLEDGTHMPKHVGYTPLIFMCN